MTIVKNYFTVSEKAPVNSEWQLLFKEQWSECFVREQRFHHRVKWQTLIISTVHFHFGHERKFQRMSVEDVLPSRVGLQEVRNLCGWNHEINGCGDTSLNLSQCSRASAWNHRRDPV